MNVKHPMGVFHSFIKNFYDKMYLRLFYFDEAMCLLYMIIPNQDFENVKKHTFSHI